MGNMSSVQRETVKNVTRVSVRHSSNIKSLGFKLNPSTGVVQRDPLGTVECEFKSGSTYQYYDVPRSVFSAVSESTSLGSTFNAAIVKGPFEYKKIYDGRTGERF